MNASQKRILVIDDEPSVVTYLETLLRDHGYDTSSADNGRTGWQQAKAVKPDLVCLDITMPEESGIRFYRNLKDDAELKATPVIIVTAVTGFGGSPESFKHFLSTRKHLPPPEGFLAKPIDQQEFLAMVARVLAARD